MFHISPVDKEELMHTFLSGRFGLPTNPDTLHSGFYIYRQEFLIETLAEDIENALTQISGTQIEYFGTIAMKSKGDLRIYQCNPLESRQNIVQLCRIGLQELPSRGYIIKILLTEKMLPTAQEHGSCFSYREPEICIRVPISSVACRDFSST